MLIRSKYIILDFILIFGLFVVYVLLIIIAFYNIDSLSAVNANGKNNVTIVLDAGHGGEDGGAVANGIIEKDINLSITNKLRDLFKSSGFNVVTTRDSDSMQDADGATLRERKVNDMKKRLSLFNENESNIVISIHQNKFTQEAYSGAQVFYSANNIDSSNLSEAVRSNIVAMLQPDNTRECKKATNDIYLLYNAKVPAIIVECGFLSNYNEAQMLKNDTYQSKMAFAVFSGFLEYYNNKGL